MKGDLRSDPALLEAYQNCWARNGARVLFQAPQADRTGRLEPEQWILPLTDGLSPSEPGQEALASLRAAARQPANRDDPTPSPRPLLSMGDPEASPLPDGEAPGALLDLEETWLQITPEHDLVGWGFNHGGVFGCYAGHDALDDPAFAVAYEDRIRILPAIACVDFQYLTSGSGLALAVGLDGTLWGWGTALGSDFDTACTPSALATRVTDAAVDFLGYLYLTEDGTLWRARQEAGTWQDPVPVLDQVVSLNAPDSGRRTVTRADGSVWGEEAPDSWTPLS